ncbi:MAG TPA: lipoyl synthase [Candidatus Goldiibacteriota bacterium]|nr:lipoyl synthase [Candidatus Goldiibacteriota bacterium]
MVKKKPYWLDKKIKFSDLNYVRELFRGRNVHTICHQAGCPNISECFSRKTATFLILGDVCTRGCAFCNVKKGTPEPVNENETDDVVALIKEMQLKFVVITSVTRDDIKDGGAGHFCNLIHKIRNMNDAIKIEILVPDFRGDTNALSKIFNAKPDVFSHNLETVPSLYHIRKGASFEMSMNVLKKAKEAGLLTKTGIMLGLGETLAEVTQLLNGLSKINCDFISIGQYLAPSKNNYPVKEYVKPETFEKLKNLALSLGFKHVESGPYVRSSYMAENYLLEQHSENPKLQFGVE